MVGMVLPILGIHPGQLRIPNHQEILAILLFRGDRPIIGTRDNDRPIQNHDFIVRPRVLSIERECDPRRQQACDGRHGGIVRLCFGIEDDVDLHAPLVGANQRPLIHASRWARAVFSSTRNGSTPSTGSRAGASWTSSRWIGVAQ